MEQEVRQLTTLQDAVALLDEWAEEAQRLSLLLEREREDRRTDANIAWAREQVLLSKLRDHWIDPPL